jgi:hypothetical protein
MKREKVHLRSTFICLDRKKGNKLYDYYNQALTASEARSFEEHLFCCFLCQEKLLILDSIFRVLQQRKEDYFPVVSDEECF